MKAFCSYLTVAALLFTGLPLFSQTQLLETPDASPAATVSQTIGLTRISIHYYRPAVRDRTIWGDLVPYGSVWRAGANDNTVIELSTDARIQGQPIPAGKYGLHVIPGKEKSTLILSHNHTAWGSFSYQPEEDALRVEIPTETTGRHYEFLTYEFEELAENKGVAVLKWSDRQFPFRIEVAPEETTLVSIRQQLQNKPGWSWQGWHEAASYCLQHNLNEPEALEWAARSVFMQPNTQNMTTKAKLAAKVKGKGQAEVSAMEIAMHSLESDLENHPVTWREWHGAAVFAKQIGRQDEALGWVNQSVRMSANMTNMMTQSEVLLAMGDEEAAKVTRREAIAHGSNRELNTYGYQLLFGGRAAEAVAIFEANAEKHPEDPNVWDSLGEGYYHHGQKEKAVKALKKSLSMDPPDNVRANSMKLLQKIGVKEADLR